MSYLRGALGVSRWDSESICEKFGMSTCANRMKCGNVYLSETESSNRIDRPLRRLKNRVEEYMCERGIDRRGWLEKQRGNDWMGRDRGSSVVAIPLGEHLE